MTVRRVVTGHDDAGVSVFLSDAEVPAERDGGGTRTSFHKFWHTASTTIAAAEPDPLELPLEGLGPGDAGNTLVRFTTIPPGFTSPMHRTETIDYGVVLEGTVHLILDDDETAMGPGDVVVQRGTVHAWENRGTEPVRLVFVLIGGTFAPELRAQIDARANAEPAA